MTYANNEEFSMELTDADLEEINGGAFQLVKGFPLGTIDPEYIYPGKIKELKIGPGFPNGMFPPIEDLGKTLGGRQF